MTNIRTALGLAASGLRLAGSASPRLDAEILLMHGLGIDRVGLLTDPGRELSEEEAAAFSGRIERRRRGEPVAYIVGEKEFWSLRFAVGPAVLIPRPETECLIEEVLRRCPPPGSGLRLLDLGTGSGAIAVVLARELPEARIAATDISAGALAVARQNAEAHGVAGRIDFFLGDLLDAVSGEFDLICSNPPYIPEPEHVSLPPGVRDFEPREALVGGPDGLDFYRRIIRDGTKRLAGQGRMFFEIGEGQQERVIDLFRDAAAFPEIGCRSDYGGRSRVVWARKG